MKEQTLRGLIQESHKRQFNGQDWQTVAVDLTPDDLPDAEREEVFEKLCGGPAPDCECGFCATAPWRD